MKKKKPSRHFFRIMSILFIVFIIIYIMIECGYYESKLSQKSALTNENIQKFEHLVRPIVQSLHNKIFLDTSTTVPAPIVNIISFGQALSFIYCAISSKSCM